MLIERLIHVYNLQNVPMYTDPVTAQEISMRKLFTERVSNENNNLYLSVRLTSGEGGGRLLPSIKRL